MNPATNLAPKLAQLYPGVYDPDGQSDSDGACGGTAQSHGSFPCLAVWL